MATSRRTQAQAESYGIKIVDIDDVDHIDVTIDGADEVMFVGQNILIAEYRIMNSVYELYRYTGLRILFLKNIK